jgi:hypothetical protein
LVCGENASNFTMKLRVRLTDCIYSSEMRGLIRSPEALLCTEKLTIGRQKGDTHNGQEELKSP